jgi:hypothetical protein
MEVLLILPYLAITITCFIFRTLLQDYDNTVITVITESSIKQKAPHHRRRALSFADAVGPEYPIWSWACHIYY